jgi:single-strand DNA-binding protein
MTEVAMNSICIEGNLARDVEVKGRPGSEWTVLQFTVAVPDRERDRETGEWADRPAFVDCTYFAKSQRAVEYLSQAMTKGTPTTVQGRIRQDSWVGKDGQRRSKLCVTCTSVTPHPRAQQPTYETPQQDAVQRTAQVPLYDGDIPF